VSGAFVQCRASAGACDPAEQCDGVGVDCPADAKSTAVCRAAAGACDVAESCDGVGDACPADVVRPAGTVCRASAGTCDVAESCDGTGVACPADTGLPDGDGDGACDVVDRCPTTPDPAQLDGDGDGLGNECDPCTAVVGTGAIKPQVSISKLLTAPGDDKIKMKGSFGGVPTVPALNPVVHGVRLILTDANGASPLDVVIPGGAYDVGTRAGWRGSSTSWVYQNAGTAVPLVGGISKITLKTVSSIPGLVKYAISGKNGSYPVPPTGLPVTMTLVLDPPLARSGQCGEAKFPGPPPVPSCAFYSAGSTLKCK
jgi:hypothetical protein